MPLGVSAARGRRIVVPRGWSLLLLLLLLFRQGPTARTGCRGAIQRTRITDERVPLPRGPPVPHRWTCRPPFPVVAIVLPPPPVRIGRHVPSAPPPIAPSRHSRCVRPCRMRRRCISTVEAYSAQRGGIGIVRRTQADAPSDGAERCHISFGIRRDIASFARSGRRWGMAERRRRQQTMRRRRRR